MEDLLRELRTIKRLLALAALSLTLIALGFMAQLVITVRMSQAYSGMLPKGGYYRQEFRSFSNNADDLIASAKYDALITLATDQIKVRPDDPYAHYYLGIAQYSKGNYQAAVDSLMRASELAPTWKAGIIKPYLEAAEKALQAKPK